MALQLEQPFHEHELRFFLAEILKTSSTPPADLVKIIQDRNIQPEWESMALPIGRSVASCRNQFNLLTNRVSSVLGPGLVSHTPGAPKPKKKRSSSNLMQQAAAEGPVQPQQYQFAPINEPGNPGAFQTVPFPTGDAHERAGKKRGRPSKAERELREAEAAARGEVYQPTKRKPKTPRPSTEGMEAGEGSELPGSKQKMKKQKTAEDLMGPPGSVLGAEAMFHATASPTDRMQVDTPERQARSTIPETQTSEFAATDSLLAGMREQAAQPGPRELAASSPPGTASSSAPLQQESMHRTQSTQPQEPGQGTIQPSEARMT